MRTFKCPVCGKLIAADIQRNGDAKLKHPMPLCTAKPGDMLRAYVAVFKPKHRFDTFENIAEKMRDKVEAMMGQRS